MSNLIKGNIPVNWKPEFTSNGNDEKLDFQIKSQPKKEDSEIFLEFSKKVELVKKEDSKIRKPKYKSGWITKLGKYQKWKLITN